MDFDAFKGLVIQKAKALGLTEYELYYQAQESTSVGVFHQELNEFTSAQEGGVCFRCIVDGKMGYASTEELSEKQAEAIVEKAAESAQVLEAEEPAFLAEGGLSYEQPKQKEYALPSTEALIQKTLQTQEAICEADPSVVDSSAARGMSEYNRIAIVNSKGLDVQHESRTAGLVAVAVVSDGNKENPEMANEFQIKLGELESLDEKKLAKEAVEKAMQKLGGGPAPTGIYPVVFSSGAMANLLATFSGVFSSENAQKGLSRLADCEGSMVAAEAVTLVDDPFYEENPMAIGFDAEGSPTYTKNVVEKGELKTLLYNLKTAALAGKKTTGNASKSGYAAPVAVQPFTMYLAPGAYTEEELLQKAGNGIYIDSLGGLHAGANPITGDFSLQSGGFMIENGQKTVPVKSFTVAGNFYELLQKVTAVGSNLEVPRGGSMTAYASPSVLVETLSIAGK